MTDAEIAWAAGLFEGEGCMAPCGPREELRLQIQSCDEDLLRRFAEIVGAGTIYGPYSSDFGDGYTRKPRWMWICKGAPMWRLIRAFQPWLGARRLARADELGLLPCENARIDKGEP